MTDARFPDYWMHDARVQTLSGDHFRAFMHALAWSAANRTDGFIRTENRSLIPRLDNAAVVTFVDVGLWVELDDGWLIVDYLATQTSRAQFQASERSRAKDRERKAKERAARFAGQQSVRTDVPTDVRKESPGRQAGRLFSKETNNVNRSDEKNGDEYVWPVEPPDDDFSPSAEQLARIDADFRRMYES